MTASTIALRIGILPMDAVCVDLSGGFAGTGEKMTGINSVVKIKIIREPDFGYKSVENMLPCSNFSSRRERLAVFLLWAAKK
ncbi:hypothetical protein ACSBLW_11240 [Thioclava sp. FR2]|uniref:hypothetical protein n=1 Tax=Thioclava sp. FR2 TaxID=3445780 RepID=UPI003EB976C8